MISSRGSTFFRVSLLAYLLLIVYASCYPFSGWREVGASPLAYLGEPLPRYWTVFDVATNIFGYAPLGLLVVFAVYPALQKKSAVLLAILAGALFSASLEGVQTYLPSRVPSNLDLIANTSGTFLGALVGVATVRSFLGQGRFHRLGQRWFRREASGILIVLTLWPLAQIYPQSSLFGHGQWIVSLSEILSSWIVEPVDVGVWIRQAMYLNIDQAWKFWLSETIITATGLTGAALTLLCLLRKNAPWVRLTALLLGCALGMKSLAIALFFGPENAFAWLTPGAIGGLLVGVLMVSGLAFAPAPVQRGLAIASLMLCLVIVNLVPANHYFLSTLQSWSQGKFLNFSGAAKMLALCWPLLALWFLIASPRGTGRNEH